MHLREERQIRGHLGVHMLGGLRHEEVRRRIVGVVDLVALRAGRLVGPDEIIRQMQGKRIVVVFGSGRINARQMIAVEHHGDRLVDGVELVKEVGGRLVGQSRTLLIGFDGLLLIVLQRSVRSGFGLEIVVLIPIVVWHVVLHGDDLQELVAIGFLDFFDGALVRRFVRHVRRIVDLVLMRDDVRTGQRVEMRESELLIVGRTRVHRRFVRVQSDGILRRPPQLVDGRRPMLARHKLLIRTGERRIEIRHAQTRQSHVFEVCGTTAISGRKHQTGGRILFDGTNVGHGILVDLKPRHARRVGEGFGQHIDHRTVGHVLGTRCVDLLRFFFVSCRDFLHGFFGIVVRLHHDFRIQLPGEGDHRSVALRIVDGIPHGRHVPHCRREGFRPRSDSAHLHGIQREERSRHDDQQ